MAGSPFRVAHGTELLTATISIGVAATLGPDDTPDTLLKRADEAMYRAKRSGGGHAFHQPTPGTLARPSGG